MKTQKPKTKKSELFAFRIEATMRPAIAAAADKLQITRAELLRRAILRECERLGCLPT
jgi:hypothetical protein